MVRIHLSAEPTDLGPLCPTLSMPQAGHSRPGRWRLRRQATAHRGIGIPPVLRPVGMRAAVANSAIRILVWNSVPGQHVHVEVPRSELFHPTSQKPTETRRMASTTLRRIICSGNGSACRPSSQSKAISTPSLKTSAGSMKVTGLAERNRRNWTGN